MPVFNNFSPYFFILIPASAVTRSIERLLIHKLFINIILEKFDILSIRQIRTQWLSNVSDIMILER
jgi:hypothetical protein